MNIYPYIIWLVPALCEDLLQGLLLLGGRGIVILDGKNSHFKKGGNFTYWKEGGGVDRGSIILDRGIRHYRSGELSPLNGEIITLDRGN